MFRSSRSLAFATIVSLVLCLVVAAAPAASPDETLAMARETYETQGPAPALPLFDKALAGYRAAGDRRGEAITLGLIGNCHKRLGDLDKALTLLEQALTMKQELGDRLEEGKTLSHLGLVYWERAEYPEAIRHLEQAAAIGKELSEPKLEGSATNNLALVYDELGDYTRSVAEYNRALELYRRTNFPRGEGDTLGNLGGVSLLLGRFREAAGYYRQALVISQRLGSRTAMSQDIGNIALCHSGLGEFADAAADFDRALALAREAGLKKEEADWLKGKGALLVETGHHGEGLELIRTALERYEASGLSRERVEALGELAALQLELGDVVSAEESIRLSLKVARDIGYERGIHAALVALGGLERRRQRPEQALALIREALDGARAAGDRGLEASCHNSLAGVLRDRGDFAAARDEARLAIEIARTEGTKLIEAEARFASGDAQLRLGRPEAALEEFAAGEQLVEGLGEPDIAWRLANARGRALEALARPKEALGAYRRAVRRIETVRGRLREERFRAGYIEERYEAYVDLVRLLLGQGRDDEAFSAAEKLRARSYLDLLSRDLDPRLTPAQQRKATELRQRIRTLQRALDTEDRASDRNRRQAREIFSAELAAAERDYERFLEELRAADPVLAAKWSLAIPGVDAIRAAMPADAVLIEFVVGGDEVMTFVLTREWLRTSVSTISRRDLTAKVALVRELVARRGNGWRAPASSLARLLIEPLERNGWLQGWRRIYLVPNGVLHHLPFVLLPHGPEGRLLVEDYELSFLPAAGTLALPGEAHHPAGTVLAVAPRSGRLRHVAAEARAVVAAHAEPRRLLLREAATESAFKSTASGYRVVHLATHSRWNRLNPLLSGLELESSAGDDGRLEVHEILGMRLDAALVTLSACETALGSDLAGSVPAGDDFVGLTRAFLHAGSDAVLASLWEVDDRSTLELMRAFYSRVSTTGPAAALAGAQRAMLASGDPALEHPYNWGAFVVVEEAPAHKPVPTPTGVSVKGR